MTRTEGLTELGLLPDRTPCKAHPCQKMVWLKHSMLLFSKQCKVMSHPPFFFLIKHARAFVTEKQTMLTTEDQKLVYQTASFWYWMTQPSRTPRTGEKEAKVWTSKMLKTGKSGETRWHLAVQKQACLYNLLRWFVWWINLTVRKSWNMSSHANTEWLLYISIWQRTLQSTVDHGLWWKSGLQ